MAHGEHNPTKATESTVVTTSKSMCTNSMHVNCSLYQLGTMATVYRDCVGAIGKTMLPPGSNFFAQPPMWRRMCFVRWSLRMKSWWQTWHLYFFSPVWVRWWRDSSSDLANFFAQPSHVHENGFSPRKCTIYKYQSCESRLRNTLWSASNLQVKVFAKDRNCRTNS